MTSLLRYNSKCFHFAPVGGKPRWKAAVSALLTLSLMGWFLCSPIVPQADAEETPVATKPASTTAAADDATSAIAKPQLVKLAAGKLILPVPAAWKAVKPRSRIIQHEFSIAATQGDTAAGRMTIMSAGGGVAANVQRWIGQFRTPTGRPLGDDSKNIDKRKIGELEVTVVDLKGDYQDSPRGPFGPKVNVPGYRMLAVIIPLEQGGTWFVKSYGPAATMKGAEPAFETMVKGIEYAR